MVPYTTMIHIADIHFGCVDPMAELEILKTQFLTPISRIVFDILAIDGDLFDRRFSANHPAITAAIEFVNRCAMLCTMRGATLVLISGTESHDAGQLSLFYNMRDLFSNLDIRIVEKTQFIETHGLKILCIPEEYGKGTAYYEMFLKQTYDAVFMHGTLVGGIPGAIKEDLDAKREPIFSIDSFSGCKGPIISGHVHTAMCLQQHMYYLSSPIRYRFGEEAEKGYAIILLNRDYRYLYQFMPIQSYRYDTINVKDLSISDPNQIIQYLNGLKSNGVDHIRLNCSSMPAYQVAILSKYVRENPSSNIKLQNATMAMNQNGEIVSSELDNEQVEKLDKLKFLLDDRIDEITKFVMYLNYNEGSEYMTVDRLKQLLTSDKM